MAAPAWSFLPVLRHSRRLRRVSFPLEETSRYAVLHLLGDVALLRTWRKSFLLLSDWMASSDCDTSVDVQRKCNLYRETDSYIIKKAVTKVFCIQVQFEEGIDDEACELVNGVDLILGEGADGVHAYLLKDVKNNNGTGLLILSDVFGFANSSTRDFAYGVDCSGYNVLVPDLFHGDSWTKE